MVHTPTVEEGVGSVIARVRTLTERTERPALAALLRQLNPVLRGWCNYFSHGVSKATFGYLDQ